MIVPPPPARPLYLGAHPDVVFGLLHPPTDASPAKTAVLICPPWGWDEVASYRSRRTWAEHLAARGHPTLRIDFPGSGDSAGSPNDPDLVGAWIAAVVAATRWLAESTPSGRVAVIGLGLGGLIAAHGLAAGAPITELVLWAAPTHGRSLLREQRAFAKLQSDRYGTTGGDGALPDGGLEIGGFIQSAETMAAIERLDLGNLRHDPLQRVLLLGRDGLPVDAVLHQQLMDAGIETAAAPGNGWGSMCFHPERYEPPVDVFVAVSDWLAAGERPATRADSAASASPPRPVAAAQATIMVDGIEVRESAIVGEDPPGGFFGILAAPVSSTDADICAVFLNAGAVRRIGPNRLWVEHARRWAARGIPTLRVDVEGIGDANGDSAMYLDVGRFYTPDREAMVATILDALEARGIGHRFVLIGLCAGAYSAFNTAAADRRVIEAIAVNPRILVWDPEILGRRNAYLVNKVLELGSWQRILTGETTRARLLEIGRAAATEAPRAARRYANRLRGRGRREPWIERLESMLDELRTTGTRIVLAFAGDEPVFDELKAEGFLDRLGSWPNVDLGKLPGDDHTLRPIAAQRALHGILDIEMERLVGAAAGTGSAGRDRPGSGQVSRAPNVSSADLPVE